MDYFKLKSRICLHRYEFCKRLRSGKHPIETVGQEREKDCYKCGDCEYKAKLESREFAGR